MMTTMNYSTPVNHEWVKKNSRILNFENSVNSEKISLYILPFLSSSFITNFSNQMTNFYLTQSTQYFDFKCINIDKNEKSSINTFFVTAQRFIYVTISINIIAIPVIIIPVSGALWTFYILLSKIFFETRRPCLYQQQDKMFSHYLKIILLKTATYTQVCTVHMNTQIK